jgi:hypothetical protein
MPPLYYWIQLVMGDAAALFAMVAAGAFHRFLLYNQTMSLDNDTNDKQIKEALFFLFEAMRHLQKRFDKASEALSNVSIFVTAVLTTCVVS